MGAKAKVFPVAILAVLLVFSQAALGQQGAARDHFGAADLPAALSPAAIGFYSEGCLAGGVAIAENGPNWQVMRPSRNRRWGHPEMIALLQRLSQEAAAEDGWPGLLIGDISQPRGGPMTSGHASHQVGLDADVWLNPMPDRRLSEGERETVSAQSVLKEGTLHVDPARWTPAHARLVMRAASYAQVDRIFVHPGIKKKLCESWTGDRSNLGKIRPYWGHHYHFHIRIECPDGSPNCRAQNPPPRGTDCDGSLAWWFTDEPWADPDDPPAPAPEPQPTQMSELPRACVGVLNAAAPPSAVAATHALPGAVPASVEAAGLPVPTPRPR